MIDIKNINPNILNQYIEYIKKLNVNRKSSSKNFYIILKNNTQGEIENINIEKLQEKYLKLKESLSRCGNILSEITNENQIKEIIFSFLNSNKF